VSEKIIDQHSDFAVYALVALCILGVAALLGLFFAFINSTLSRTVAIITLVISLVSFGLIAYTGYLGGQIRHTEISTAIPIEQQNEEEDD
jgi:uncharacterized membrane protein